MFNLVKVITEVKNFQQLAKEVTDTSHKITHSVKTNGVVLDACFSLKK